MPIDPFGFSESHSDPSAPTGWKPYKMLGVEETQRFFSHATPTMKEHARILQNQKGWRFHAVAQTRGRCFYGKKVITLPQFAQFRGPDYINWYVSHEIAHAFAGWEANHGPEFMRWLKIICPPEAIHHELGYKPRNAAAAGISVKIVEI